MILSKGRDDENVRFFFFLSFVDKFHNSIRVYIA